MPDMIPANQDPQEGGAKKRHSSNKISILCRPGEKAGVSSLTIDQGTRVGDPPVSPPSPAPAGGLEGEPLSITGAGRAGPSPVAQGD